MREAPNENADYRHNPKKPQTRRMQWIYAKSDLQQKIDGKPAPKFMGRGRPLAQKPVTKKGACAYMNASLAARAVKTGNWGFVFGSTYVDPNIKRKSGLVRNAAKVDKSLAKALNTLKGRMDDIDRDMTQTKNEETEEERRGREDETEEYEKEVIREETGEQERLKEESGKEHKKKPRK